MAKTKTTKEKVGAALELEKFNAKHKGKDLTDPQKKEKAEIAARAKQEKFVEVANKRIPKTLSAIGLLANLGASGYKSTDVQQKAIVKALRDAVDRVEGALSGKKAAGFTLPTTEEAE